LCIYLFVLDKTTTYVQYNGVAEQDLVSVIGAQRERFNAPLPVGMIERDGLTEARARLREPLVKVIIGPRRAGKSTFARQLVHGMNAAILNFDDDNLIRFFRRSGTAALIPSIELVHGAFDVLVLDEIQNVPDWELLINRLHGERFNLIVTGSNANLLSSELSSHLTGRFVEIEILPFSWTEARRARPDLSLDDFLLRGGFPEVVLGQVEPTSYLTALSRAVLLTDIASRYSIRQPVRLTSLWTLLSAQFGGRITVSKLQRVLEFQSKTTLQNYLRYLSDAYLHIELIRYSAKVKEQLKAPRKSYLYDLGFASAHTAFDASARRLENAVFIQLLRRIRATDEVVYYYQTARGGEVDFVLRRGSQTTELLQCCYTLNSADTREREFRALTDAARELDCQRLRVVTFAERGVERVNGRSIEMLPAARFLAEGGN
jgi:uncharacterized protein